MRLIAVFVVAVISLHVCLAFSPNVTIQSCASRRVVIRLVNAVDGGLLFIQGAGKECIKTTRPASTEHEFNFDICNIEYDSKFRLVIQQHAHYQTGTDKVIPVMCLVDKSDLVVSGVIYPEERTDDQAVNKTVKPSVRMRILAGDGVTSVDEVNLNDKIKMLLTLDDPYIQDFDIKAKDCVASSLSLLKEECSSDEDFFPNFNKQRQGALQSEFQAFQPTSLVGQTEADVAFTCNVTVCKGQCRQKICGEIVGWGRKKRGDNDDEYEKVTVGCKLKVKKPDPDMGTAHGIHATPDFYCGQKMVVTSVIAVVLVTLVFSWLVCALIFVKMRRLSKLTAMGIKKPGPLRRMSQTGSNIAKSVGRRLSTILNLPVGYDVKERKMMDAIPEMPASPGPGRRDSVTVSPDDVNDVSYVSVYDTSDETHLRKRLVDKSAQTDSVVNTASGDVKDLRPKKNPFSFITSISIKSGVSKNKQSGFANPAFSQSFDAERSNSAHAHNRDVTERFGNVVTYGENDVPRNRSRSAQNLDYSQTYRRANDNSSFSNPHRPLASNRSVSPTPDYEEKDVSFNDGSIHDENSCATSNEQSRDYNAMSNNGRYVNTNDVEDKNSKPIEPSSSIVPVGNRFDDDVTADVTDDIHGRLTPVEHYYEPIEIVSKPKCLTRTVSTHV